MNFVNHPSHRLAHPVSHPQPSALLYVCMLRARVVADAGAPLELHARRVALVMDEVAEAAVLQSQSQPARCCAPPSACGPRARGERPSRLSIPERGAPCARCPSLRRVHAAYVAPITEFGRSCRPLQVRCRWASLSQHRSVEASTRRVEHLCGARWCDPLRMQSGKCGTSPM